jgi:hypothetical protein
MSRLPLSVTVISSWLIVSAILALMVNLAGRTDPKVVAIMARNPIPITVQIVWVYAGILISFVSGIGLLKRQNWARVGYVVWSCLSLLVSFATSPVKAASMPGVVFLAVISYFLFHPKVKHVFSPSAAGK